MAYSDTIFALSSGQLPAGVAVVRISGPQVRFALETIAGRIPSARRMVLASFRSADGTLLDRGMAAFFPAPASATGEDMAELHLHGSRAIVAATSRCLAGLPGIRVADPGEFTRRAFLNGKLDLLQAEALADLIDAETDGQRRLALASADGEQSRLYENWRKRLLHARAMIEAELDFSDEDDVPGSVSEQIWTDLGAMVQEIQSHVAGYGRAEIIRDGYVVVIMGPPNAGKSSLINAMARREVAIVSDEPGTTRDLVEVALELNGLKVRLIDTAGLRQHASSAVERIGIERATAKAAEADLVLALGEGSELPGQPLPADVPFLRVATKLDLAAGARPAWADLAISTATGEGVEQLVAAIAKHASDAAGEASQLPFKERHVAILRNCVELLKFALGAEEGIETRAEYLRDAASQLGRITGASNVEELLGSIFSSFCIGK